MRTRLATRIAPPLLALVCAGCLDDTAGIGSAPPTAGGAGTCQPGRLLVAVTSDYQSSGVALLDLAQVRPLASRFLHSGSHVGATGAALSGDVVPASGADCTSRIVDRSRGVITALRHGDGVAPGVTGQWNVSGGFFSNVQDVVELGPQRWGVVRAQRRLGDGGGDGDGDDFLVFDAQSGETVGRAALGPHASLPGAHAFGGRTAVLGAGTAGWRAFVPLASVAPGFDAMGGARVAIVVGEGANGARVQRVIDLPAPLRNCTTARRIGASGGGGGRLAVLCSGFFKSAAQAEESAVVILDADDPLDPVELVLAATATGAAPARPFFGDVTCDADRCFAIALGDGASKRADEIRELSMKAGVPSRRVHLGSAPFSCSGLYYDAARERLWMTDSGNEGGDVVVATCRWPAACVVDTALRASTLGLPAIALEGP